MTPDGAGTGSSWDDPASLATAVSGAAAEDEIWLKAGTYTPSAGCSASKALTLRGGFAGTESSAADRTAAAGYSVIDGQATVPSSSALLTFAASSGTVRLERIELKRSKYRGFQVSGGASAVLDTCRIIDNGYNGSHYVGRGIYAAGTATATLTLTNCAVEGNIMSARTASGSDIGNGNDAGGGLYAKTFASVSITDCAFVTNGLPNKASARSSRDSTRGFTIFAEAAPVHLLRTSFVGNGALVHGSNCGGTVFLNGACGGSTVSNCLFISNFSRHWGTGVASYGGALVVCLSTAADKATLGNCTFAYNTHMPRNVSGDVGAAGLMVAKGDVACANSIFYGNFTKRATTSGANMGADAYCSANGTLALDNCFVIDPTDADYLRNNGGTLTVTNNHAEDPLLASDKAAFLATMQSTSVVWPYCTSDILPKNNIDMTTLDAHLRSIQGRWNGTDFSTQDAASSPAIDVATGVTVGDEPAPNGNVANCGAYGRTAQASLTAVGQPKIGNDFWVDQMSDSTQPHVSFTLGGTGIYSADVFIHCGLTQGNDDGTGWDKTVTAALAATNGQSVASGFRRYFATGERVYWLVRVVASYGSDAKSGDLVIIGETPAFHGRGGPAYVIHVRDNPGGDETGEDWESAVATLPAAVALLSETKTEIWIAGDLPVTKAVAVPTATTIRGGFNLYETNAADRVANAVSVLDGCRTYPASEGGLLNLTAASGAYVLDGLEVTRSYYRGVQKTGAADLTLVGCRLTDNGCRNNCYLAGRGLYATGAAASSRLVVTNSQFIGNREHSGGSEANDLTGAGAYVKNFQSVEIRNALFLTNGYKSVTGWSSAPGRDRSHGAAIYLENAPSHFADCRFIGNAAISHNTSGNDGGTVYLTGTSGGSSFTNCEWTGNFEGCYNGYGQASGALVVSLSSAADTVSLGNCTFAFNFSRDGSSSARGAAGLHCRKGTVLVADTIFYGNFYWSGSGYKADLYVTQNATCDVRNCIFEAEDARYYAAESGYSANLTLTDCRFTDPLFASNRTDFIKFISGTSASGPALTSTTPPYYTNPDLIPTLDTRLMSTMGRLELLTGEWVVDSVDSPAIDTASPDVPYDREPMPNGGRANLGSWGNTYAASLTAVGEPEIEYGSGYFTNDYTQPYYDVKIGGRGSFNASVYFCCVWGLNPPETHEGAWDSVRLVAATNGSVIFEHACKYYKPSDDISWTIFVETAAYTKKISGQLRVPINLYPPPWNGRKGPENVLHVRSDATGTGDGSSWTDALTLPEAVKLLTVEKNEIWIASSVTNDSEYLVIPNGSFTVRGGFSSAWETNAADLAEGAYSTVDVAGHNVGLRAAPVSGETVTVEDVRFVNSKHQALCKTGAGNLVVKNCRFENCGKVTGENVALQGRGIYATGTKNVSGLVVSNCLFRGNRILVTGYGSNSGSGIYADGAKAAVVTDSLFATNGTPFGSIWVGGRDGTHGSGLFLANAPGSTVRRCRFVGNGCPSHHQEPKDGGAALWIGGDSDGTTVEHCQFLGNFSRRVDIPCLSRYSGAVMVQMSSAAKAVSFDKCTFAYNFAADAGGAVQYYSSVLATNHSAGAMLVYSGAATVANSIFWGNFATTNAASFAAGDVYVCRGASAAVRYSLFASDAAGYVGAEGGGTLTVENATYGDPALVTRYAEFANLLGSIGTKVPPLMTGDPYFKVGSDPTVFNAHLRGSRGYLDEHTRKRTMYRGVSAAVDAGDPAADCTQEPRPNGRRLNLGAYGNTPNATRTGPAPLLMLIR